MRCLFTFISLFFCFQIWAQKSDFDSEVGKITPFIQALQDFSDNIPNEKVYLHFDNTSYYQGDNIWFKCYVVTSGQHKLSELSKTLYVELLNPGGEIIDKRILKVENGQCHGDFSLFHLPFYSGFYEVRAYTKYMLNFGEEIIFSRMIPVFDRPKQEGNYEDRKILEYSRWGEQSKYPMKRKRPEKEKDVNFRFFPEGGNLVQGISSRIAFEATDKTGNPIEITGIVTDNEKREICRITTLHEGKGIFTYTPSVSNRKATAEIEFLGKKHRFDLPAALPQGVIMEVDNLSLPDSIGITLRRNAQTQAELFGVAVLNGGRLQNAYYAYMEDEEVGLMIDETGLPSGVSQIVLFDSKGKIVCDRLIFINKNDFLDIKVKTDKPFYMPNEPVNMEISVSDNWANPLNTTFSLSVRDGANEIEYKHNIQTDLLLMSEIKGYVHDPSYYFETDDKTHRTALDVLLMVQGWRRYSWKQMAGIEPIEIKNLPEQGIETNGQVVSFMRQIPKPDVDVGLLLQKKREEDDEFGDSFVETYVTDNEGRFSFASDLEGRWNMILTVSEKGKKKDHRIILDRVFSPEPKRYRYADMQVNIADNTIEPEEETENKHEEDFESLFIAFQDSLSKAGISDKVQNLKEVTITAKKNTKEDDIRRNRSTSLVYYDVASELDDIYDKGEYIGDDIHQLLISMDENFHLLHTPYNEYMCYEINKIVLFVINYEILDDWDNYFNYKNIKLSAIKSIYINNLNRDHYLNIPELTTKQREALFSNRVVFIETYPEGQVPVDGAKGVRKTWLEGYSSVKEFYNPDYSMPPLDLDYRRTLYWNPNVTTDENGVAKIRFYNNSSCKNFSINAETVTSQGMIGTYNNK